MRQRAVQLETSSHVTSPGWEAKVATLLFISSKMNCRVLIGVPELRVRRYTLFRTWCLPIFSAIRTGPSALPQVWQCTSDFT
jgi:hypothetical protein